MSAISSETRIRPLVRWIRWLASQPNVVLAYWQRRELIKNLRELNDHQLRDIGLRRDQIETAVNGVVDSDISRFLREHGRR
jgi:uncharacterized protein YjiS (DUF1127 family)